MSNKFSAFKTSKASGRQHMGGVFLQVEGATFDVHHQPVSNYKASQQEKEHFLLTVIILLFLLLSSYDQTLATVIYRNSF